MQQEHREKHRVIAAPGSPVQTAPVRQFGRDVRRQLFLDKIGEHFETTRFAIEDALKFHKKNKLSPQLEIETYTWDVLPDSMKSGSIVDYVERELDWVKGQLV